MPYMLILRDGFLYEDQSELIRKALIVSMAAFTALAIALA